MKGAAVYNCVKLQFRKNRINKAAKDGSRRVRIHTVGFPVVMEQTDQSGNTGERFATLMRALCQRNGGTFVGLNSTKP